MSSMVHVPAIAQQPPPRKRITPPVSRLCGLLSVVKVSRDPRLNSSKPGKARTDLQPAHPPFWHSLRSPFRRSASQRGAHETPVGNVQISASGVGVVGLPSLQLYPPNASGPQAALDTTNVGRAATSTPNNSARVPKEQSPTTTDPLLLILEDLRQAQIEAKANRRTYTNHDGEVVAVVDRVSRILKCFSQYAGIIDIAIQHDPKITSLVWAGIRLILQVALNRLSYIENLEFTAVIVVGKMATCEFYAHVYAGMQLEKHALSAQTQENMRDRLNLALNKFYDAIKKFVLEAQKHFSPSVASYFITFDQRVQPLLIEIEKCETSVRRCAEMATMQRVMASVHLRDLKAAVDTICLDMQSIVRDKLEAILLAIHEGVAVGKQVQHAAEKTYDIVQEIRDVVVGPSVNNGLGSLSVSFDVGVHLFGRHRNMGFVGREYLLQTLERTISQEQTCAAAIHVVLFGMGGVGKTQLALEYINKYSSSYSAVFWVDAKSTHKMHQSFIEILQELIQHHVGLSGNRDYMRVCHLLGVDTQLLTAGRLQVKQPDEWQVIAAVQQYLGMKGNTKWLLVFDNVDDLELIDLGSYIPSCCHGTVLITSRRRETTFQRVGFEVEQMHPDEAENLLFKSAGKSQSLSYNEVEQLAVRALISKLGYLPLAISQAGAFIYTRSYTFARYLKEYETNVETFLSRAIPHGNYPLSVFAAWELSFATIEKQCPEAAELLLLCGFLDNDDISEEMLRRGKKLSVNDLTVGDSIESLFCYSLAHRKGREDSFTIHPLVHERARGRLGQFSATAATKALEAFLLVTTSITVPANASRSVNDWMFERRIMPHLMAVGKHFTKQYKESTINDIQVLSAMGQLAKIYAQHGQADASLEWFQRELDGRNSLDPNHPDTLTTLHHIALVLGSQGQFQQAEEWFRRALAGREISRDLGTSHPDTLSTIHELGLVFDGQGKYDLALEWYKRALEGRERVLGREDLDTLNTVNNIALIYDKQGQYNLAQEWYQRALIGRENGLGRDHPETLGTINNIALVLTRLGRHDEALGEYMRALDGKERILGPQHPSVLKTCHNIGVAYSDKGMYSAALEWLQRALSGRETLLEYQHPETLATIHEIGSVYQRQGQYKLALTWYQRALTGREQLLGSNTDHPEILGMMCNIATIFKAQEEFDTAMDWYQRVLGGQERSLGPQHPDTLITVHNIASVLNSQGKQSEALDWYKRALDGEEESLGTEHVNTLTTVGAIADIYNIRGQYDTALEWYQRALIGMQKALGENHPSTLVMIYNIGSVYETQDSFETALEWYQRALPGQEKVLGATHPRTMATLDRIASSFCLQEKYEKATDNWEKLLACQESRGSESLDTLCVLHNLGFAYKQQGQTENSITMFERSLTGRLGLLGLEDPATRNTARELADVLHSSGEVEQARRVREKFELGSTGAEE